MKHPNIKNISNISSKCIFILIIFQVPFNIFVKILKNILFNHFIILPINLSILFIFYDDKTIIANHSIWKIFIYYLFQIIVVKEVIFYHIHKLFHNKYLYSFHKKHHEHYFPLCILYNYADTLDFIFLSYSPIIIGENKFIFSVSNIMQYKGI